MAVFLTCPQVLRAQMAAAEEYEVKAAFLYNFAKFVEWPPDAFDDSSSPFVIGVLGEDPFGRALDRTVHGKQVQGRPIEIQRWRRMADIRQCHILFVSVSDQTLLLDAVQRFRGPPVLTVADETGLEERGAVIQFLIRDKKVRFEINNRAARESGLRISSLLLTLALHVWE